MYNDNNPTPTADDDATTDNQTANDDNTTMTGEQTHGENRTEDDYVSESVYQFAKMTEDEKGRIQSDAYARALEETPDELMDMLNEACWDDHNTFEFDIWVTIEMNYDFGTYDLVHHASVPEEEHLYPDDSPSSEELRNAAYELARIYNGQIRDVVSERNST